MLIYMMGRQDLDPSSHAQNRFHLTAHHRKMSWIPSPTGCQLQQSIWQYPHTDALEDPCIIWSTDEAGLCHWEDIWQPNYCIWTVDKYNSWFEVLTVVWHGCVLSPLLVAVAIDWVLWLATMDWDITWLHHSHLSDPDISDDITALEDNTHDLQDLVNSICDHVGMLSLSINAKKLGICWKGMLVLYRCPCKWAECWKHWRVHISWKFHPLPRVIWILSCRIGEVSAAFSQLGKIWKNRTFSQRLKLHLYHSNNWMLFYRCETLYLKVSQEKRLDGFNWKWLWRILSIHCSDFISDEEVRKQSECLPVSSVICKWCLNWLGQVCRLPATWPVNLVLQWVPPGHKDE